MVVCIDWQWLHTLASKKKKREELLAPETQNHLFRSCAAWNGPSDRLLAGLTSALSAAAHATFSAFERLWQDHWGVLRRRGLPLLIAWMLLLLTNTQSISLSFVKRSSWKLIQSARLLANFHDLLQSASILARHLIHISFFHTYLYSYADTVISSLSWSFSCIVCSQFYNCVIHVGGFQQLPLEQMHHLQSHHLLFIWFHVVLIVTHVIVRRWNQMDWRWWGWRRLVHWDWYVVFRVWNSYRANLIPFIWTWGMMLRNTWIRSFYKTKLQSGIHYLCIAPCKTVLSVTGCTRLFFRDYFHEITCLFFFCSYPSFLIS